MSGLNTSPTKKSQYERKLARQRQLELMEAAASGTAPSMELDTSSFAETDGSFLRARQTENNNAIAIDTGIAQHQPNNNNKRSAFGNPRDQVGTSLNLMDHATGVYQEHKGGFFSKLFRAKTGTDSASSSFNASPALQDNNDHVGHVYGRSSTSSSSSSSSRVSPFTAACKSTLSNRRRVVMMGTIALGMFVVIFSATTISSNRVPSQKVLRQRNSARFNAIFDHIVLEGVSHTDVFLSTKAPEYHALRWVAYTDPAELDPQDPLILQRYALASFYYSSFLTFQERAGLQKPIELDDEEFYEGVPNPGWTRKDYWMSAKGICMWHGVFCGVRDIDGEIVTRYDDNVPIVGLNLTGNRVYGTLPPEFKGLDSLDYLDLSDNRMHGTFPYQMGRMFELEQLFLDRNSFSGQIPADIGLVESAREIRLAHNKFTGSIPPEIARLFQLHTIALDHNELDGTIPDLSPCHKLKHFLMNNNALTGKFPFVLAKMTHLVEIDVHNNQLSGTIPPELENCRLLETIEIQSNKIAGSIPHHAFKKLVHLKKLYMEDNLIEGTIPPQVGDLTQLRELRISNNKMAGPLPESFGNMKNLQVLHLQENKFGGPIPSQIGGMTELKEFWAHDNEFNLIPTEMGLMEKVETLYLERNKFKGAIPSELGNLENLGKLRLFHNLFTGSVPQHICTLKTLNDLSFLAADCHDRVPCACCDKCY